MTRPFAAGELWTRRSCFVLRKLLDSPGAANLLLESLPDPKGFGIAALQQIVSFNESVLDESLEFRPRHGRHRRLKLVVRQHAMTAARNADFQRLLTELGVKKLIPLAAEDLRHIYAALREGILCAFHDALGAALLASASGRSNEPKDLPLLELAWVRTLTISTLAAGIYPPEVRLLYDHVFRDSDEDTRQYIRENQGATHVTATAANTADAAVHHVLTVPTLTTGLTLLIGWKLGASVASICLIAVPLWAIMIQAWQAYAIAAGTRRIPFSYDPACCPVTGAVAVAVPVLLHRTFDEAALAKRMQENFQRQSLPCVIVILTDFEDSATEEASAEENRRLDRLQEAMNIAFEGSERSWMILHRERCYTQTQGTCMGWERKRGKILQFCQLLHFGIDNFSKKLGAAGATLSGVEWVFVVDEDSVLLRGALDNLAASAFHPINQSVDVRRARRISAPAVSSVPSPGSRWRFDRFYCTWAGRNPWFDSLGEVPFSGKGLFRASELVSTAAIIQQERILSHDTLEGYLLGTTYCDNSRVVESIPASYVAVIARHHRWVRGDIQNWVYGRCALMRKFAKIHSISLQIHRLAQIVFPISLLVCMHEIGGSDWRYFVAALVLLLFAPTLSACFGRLWHRFVPSIRYLISEASGLVQSASIYVFRATTAAHISAVTIHAAMLVLFRAMTGRHLLEWTTSGQSNSRSAAIVRAGWASGIAAVLTLGLFDTSLPQKCLLIVWGLFPFFAPVIFAHRRRFLVGEAKPDG